MLYEYKMVQIPTTIIIKAKEAKGQEAAWYLQQTVTEFARSGWEFYRIDTVGVVQNPGCLASIFGASKTFYNYYVVSFRREVDAGSQAGRHEPVPPPLPV